MTLCVIVCGFISVASIVAVVVLTLAARAERRELYDRMMCPSLEAYRAASGVPKSHITTHEKAIKKWRHDDTLPTEGEE